tara:strand:- start:1452 stop:1628 length:177 start_codon:yes stop_codon:yes gene_type:complete
MEFSRNTSTSKTNSLLIKIVLILVIVIGAIAILGNIDFPSPNNEIIKIISNENLKIVK